MKTRHAEQDDLHGVHRPAADPKLHKYPICVV
jgi:hypothetical protein